MPNQTLLAQHRAAPRIENLEAVAFAFNRALRIENQRDGARLAEFEVD